MDLWKNPASWKKKEKKEYFNKTRSKASEFLWTFSKENNFPAVDKEASGGFHLKRRRIAVVSTLVEVERRQETGKLSNFRLSYPRDNSFS